MNKPPDFNFDNLSREEKEELLRLLSMREEMEKDKVLKHRQYSLIQRAFLCATAKIVGFTGSNRSGKSLAGGDLIAICSTGEIPDSIREEFPRELIRSGAYWCSAFTFQMSKDISEGKIFSAVPRSRIINHNKEQRKISLDNANEIGFKSTESGDIAYAGVSRVMIWADEEHPKPIYSEMYMRTIDCAGRIRMTFTPVKGLTWAYGDLYKKAGKYVYTINTHGIPEDVGIVHTPEELEKLRDRKLVVQINTSAEANPNIEFYSATMYDNPHLPLSEIQNAEQEFKNDIGAYNSRVLGRFTQLSGNKVFNVPTLLKLQGGIASNHKRYTLFNKQLKHDPRGSLTIFKEKKEQGQYVIGADVAEGLEDGDYSCAQVLDRRTCEQVAIWHGKISPEKFADVLDDLGRFYNTAMIGPERNFHGFGVVNRLREVHKYPSMYYHYKLEEQVLTGHSAQKKTYGWDTNSKTKPVMIQDLSAFVRDGHIKINDFHTIDEMITYVYDKEGKLGAMGGCKDDRVMALAIALQLYKRTSSNSTQVDPKPKEFRGPESMGY